MQSKVDRNLAILKQLNEEVNQQLIFTPNYFDNLEDALNYIENNEEQHFLYDLYKHINQLFKQFLYDNHCTSTSLTPALKEMFQSQLQRSVKKLRDNDIIARKYSFSDKLQRMEEGAEKDYFEKDQVLLEKEIEQYFKINLSSALEILYSGQELEIQDNDLKERFKQRDALVDYRNQYGKDVLSQALGNNLEASEIANLKQKLNYFCQGLYLERMQVRVGQCGEHTSLALVKLLKGQRLDWDTTIEAICNDYYNHGLYDDNHVFLVINRDPNSDLTDMSTWGTEAIVFDSWKKLVFKASDYLSYRYINGGEQKNYSAVIFDNKDANFLRTLNKNDIYLQITGNTQFAKLIPLLIEENQLIAIDGEQFEQTNQLLNDLLKEVRPANFNLNIKFYLTTAGNQLIQTITGFQEPTIILHRELFNHTDDQALRAELRFALAQQLLTVKKYGVGINNNLSAPSLYELDREALNVSNNGDAVINYLRRAQQFYEAHKEEEPAQALPDIMRNILQEKALPATFEQRIKNLMTYFASDTTSLKETSFSGSLAAVRTEVAAIKPTFFYQENFEQQDSVVAKLNYLTERLSSLKEHELLPYELTEIPGIRVREFCQLLYSLTIDWSDEAQIQAVDKLINQAFELRVPGFDRIYVAIHQLPFSDSYYSHEKNLKALGPFKDLQDSVRNFSNAMDESTAKEQAKLFKSIYKKLSLHLFPTGGGRNHLATYQKNHQGMVPTGNERFFASHIGLHINWQGFDEKQALQLDNFLAWAKADKEGDIAELLWHLGITHPIVLSALPDNFKEAILVSDGIRTIEFSAPRHLKEEYPSHPGWLAMAVIQDGARHHQLVDTFQTSEPFEQQFIQFYDNNYKALRGAADSYVDGRKINLNNNNSTVRCLLTKFTEIALTGTPKDKALVKSFFLGRKDKRDLASLNMKATWSSLTLDSLYYQFCFYQRYAGQNFVLFSPNELIALIRDKHISDFPTNLLLRHLGLPYEDLTLECLAPFLKELNTRQLDSVAFNADKLVEQHIHTYGPYPLFSHETAQLLALTDINSHIDQKEILKLSISQAPSDLLFSQLKIKDLVTIYKAYEA
uniref:hypothetical protein n=1 Tax=Legionella gresilensis TaxID=91823 RepID=UPI003D00C903